LILQPTPEILTAPGIRRALKRFWQRRFEIPTISANSAGLKNFRPAGSADSCIFILISSPPESAFNKRPERFLIFKEGLNFNEAVVIEFRSKGAGILFGFKLEGDLRETMRPLKATATGHKKGRKGKIGCFVFHINIL